MRGETPKIGKDELKRDVNNGVIPDSVKWSFYSGAVVLDSGAMMFGGGFSRQSGTPSTSELVEIYRSAR